MKAIITFHCYGSHPSCPFALWLLVFNKGAWDWPEDNDKRLGNESSTIVKRFREAVVIQWRDCGKTPDESMWCLSTDFFAEDPHIWGLPIRRKAVWLWNRLKLENRTLTPTPPLSLYHGTTRKNAQQIMKVGFVLPTRCKTPESCMDNCTCYMMGKCIYFADFPKAYDHAHQSSTFEKIKKGAVVRAFIRIGNMVTQSPKPCPCCDKPYVDHKGEWMKEKYGIDILFLAPYSLPAVKRPEWCVKSRGDTHAFDWIAV